MYVSYINSIRPSRISHVKCSGTQTHKSKRQYARGFAYQRKLQKLVPVSTQQKCCMPL